MNNELQALLNRYFPGEAQIVDPQSVKLRGRWKEVFAAPRAKWRHGALDLWSEYSEFLPTFTEAQEKLLTDVVPARIEGLLCVIYAFRISGRIWLYRGGMPITDESALKYLQPLPPTLLEFYRSMHDGYTFIPGNTVGPLPSGEMWTLDEQEWDWLESEEDADQYEPLDEKSVVFANGGGGYIVLDTSEQQDDDAEALIWWDNEKPETEAFWPLLDAWMEIGLTKD